MMPSNGQVTVPPGFRFHPTDEELLYYYLRKKVAFEAIDLDVIREIDVNKLEPWDLREKCRIGTGPQNEWYFFSHKDKKYPTGTRTNRATHAGFWKATGRDKAIHLTSSKRIGMRKTLVFYTGRAPHGQKTDWIMHEYRLDDESSSINQEDGWVVCRVFKKKNYQRGVLPPEAIMEEEDHELMIHSLKQQQQQQGSGSTNNITAVDQKQNFYSNIPSHHNDFSFNTSMHLPQLLSSESTISNIPTALPFSNMPQHSLDLIECSHNLIKLTSSAGEAGGALVLPAAAHQISTNGELSILDKLLVASHHNLDQLFLQMSKGGSSSSSNNNPSAASQLMELGAPISVLQRNPNLQYLGCEPHLLRFSN